VNVEKDAPFRPEMKPIPQKKEENGAEYPVQAMPARADGREDVRG